MIPYIILWDEIGFYKKIIVQAPENYFFVHAWMTSNPPQIYMGVGLGTWNIVFLISLKKTEALQTNNFSSSEKLFFRAYLDCSQSTPRSICG